MGFLQGLFSDPLVRAVKKADAQAARMALSKGADPFMPMKISGVGTRGPVPAFMAAVLRGNWDLVEAFLEHECDVASPIQSDSATGVREGTPLHHAIWAVGIGKAEPDYVRFFIEKGADVNSVGSSDVSQFIDGARPLHLAIECPKAWEVIEMLLENGADPNAWADDMTTLHVLMGTAHTPSAFGIDDDTPESEYEKVLIRAKQIAVLLLKHGADINARLKSCQTPLAYARSNLPVNRKTGKKDEDTELIKFLVEQGAAE
ncbi:ankyrin repeat domain-containing protein [Candidatus Hydrogenedentota bacterium]